MRLRSGRMPWPRASIRAQASRYETGAAGMPGTSGVLTADLPQLCPQLVLGGHRLVKLALLVRHDLWRRLGPELATRKLALEPVDLRAHLLESLGEAAPLGLQVEQAFQRDHDVDRARDEAGGRPPIVPRSAERDLLDPAQRRNGRLLAAEATSRTRSKSSSALGSMSCGAGDGHGARMIDGSALSPAPPGMRCQISSVMKGMKGCSNRRIDSRALRSTCRATSWLRLPSSRSASLATSRYQSQYSFHTKEYRLRAASEISNASRFAVTSAIVDASRDRIQRSAGDRSSKAGGSFDRGVSPRFMRTNREAFQSLLAKLRAPAVHSSWRKMSCPVACSASMNRKASVP